MCLTLNMWSPPDEVPHVLPLRPGWTEQVSRVLCFVSPKKIFRGGLRERQQIISGLCRLAAGWREDTHSLTHSHAFRRQRNVFSTVQSVYWFRE